MSVVSRIFQAAPRKRVSHPFQALASYSSLTNFCPNSNGSPVGRRSEGHKSRLLTLTEPHMMDTETRASEKDESTAPNLPLSDDSDSSSDGNSSNREENRIEWLATTRKRRSTAGNRMKSMLANEEPDSDLELLFAEDEDDQAFSEAGDDGSDVQMDSSSDDEDDNNNNNGGDDLEGEKELERRAKERRAAQRKRKTQEAIPAKFRKKVRIDSATPTVSTPASTPTTTAQPRSKKKSERMSWLPSMTDMPTRASSRQTTRMSKEQLHQQMVEREARRLKQLDQMQKKAAKLEALKKPPMTQEDRLREAAIVEQRNSKSLNRWEVAEKQREEERRAKLAALHERTLKGPVITFWSGLGHSQRIVVVEEKPKKKREKVDKSTKEKDKVKASTPKDTKDDEAGVTEGAGAKTIPDKEVQQSSAAGLNKEGDETSQPPGSTSVEPLVTAESKELIKTQPIRQEGDENLQAHVEASQTPSQLSLQPPLPTSTKPAVSSSEVASPSLSVSRLTPHQTLSTSSDTSIACESLPLSVPSPAVATPTLEKEADGNVAPQRPQLLAMPPPPSSLASGLAAPFSAPSAQNQASPLATPAGISMPEPNGKPVGVLAAPVLALPPSIGVGFGLQSSPKSHVLAPPNTSQQRPAPLPTLSVKTQDHLPSTGLSSTEAVILNQPLQSLKNEAEIASGSVSPSISEPPTATGSSADLTTTRNTIILQNFDETAIRDKSVQTHILFGRKMNKLSSMVPCVS